MYIGILDYKLGNVFSVCAALKRLNVKCVITSKYKELKDMNGIVLPGVGAFSEAMSIIKKNKIDSLLYNLVYDHKKPLLGICLGMQILADWGEEFEECRGLGLIPGRVRKLLPGKNRKIPHVGWSQVQVRTPGKEMFSRAFRTDSYYFDHSYVFEAKTANRAATVSWDENLVAGVVQEKVWGVQFHPEKSQTAGLRLLKTFCIFCQK